MPAVNTVDDRAVFPPLVKIGVIRIMLYIGGRVFYFYYQYIIRFYNAADVKFRTAEHPFMFAQIHAVKIEMRVIANARKAQIRLRKTAVIGEFVLKPPGFISGFSGKFIVSSHHRVWYYSRLKKRGLNGGGNVCLNRIFKRRYFTFALLHLINAAKAHRITGAPRHMKGRGPGNFRSRVLKRRFCAFYPFFFFERYVFHIITPVSAVLLF